MSKYVIDSSTLTGIANAIRTKYGEDTTIAVTDMAEAILGIEGGSTDEVTLESVELSKLGWNVPSGCPIQNELDEDNGLFIQRVGRVDLGSLTWEEPSTSSPHRFMNRSLEFVCPTEPSEVPKIYCENYNTIAWSAGIQTADGAISAWYSAVNVLAICDYNYSTASQFKTALSGVYLYYQLETSQSMPIVAASIDLNGWVLGSFTVASDTQTAQTIDFSELGDVSNIKCICHAVNASNKGSAYGMIGFQTFAGNPLITYNYQGTYSTGIQSSNCPITIDYTSKSITWGACTGNYKFKAGYTYQYIILPIIQTT